jgi:transposase-like protein
MPPSPEAWARIRHAYEHSDRSVSDICAEHGISSGTLRDRVRRWKWNRRREPIPPLGPPPLVQPPTMTAPTFAGPNECVPDAREQASVSETCEAASPPVASNEAAATSTRGDDAAPPPSYSRFVAQEAQARSGAPAAPLADRLQGAIDRIMPAIETTLATLASGSLHPRQMELAARSLGALTRTLRELNGLLAQQATDEPEGPRDMEEFRLLLTERMNAMLRQREEEAPRIYHEAWEDFAAQVRRDAVSE